MNQTYRKTLLAGAIAALLATPIIAAGEVTRDGAQDSETSQSGQQWRDGTTTDRSTTPEAPYWPQSSDPSQTSDRSQARGDYPQEGAQSGMAPPAVGPATEGYTMDGVPQRGLDPRAAATTIGDQANDNPLYSRSFEDLNGMDVVDSAGEDIGELTGVVLSPDRQSAHAVVSSGGFLGMGTRETLVSFSELKSMDDQLQMNTTEEAFKARSEFQADDYIRLDGDRPILESIAEASQSEPGYGSDQRMDTLPRGTGESEGWATTPPRNAETR